MATAKKPADAGTAEIQIQELHTGRIEFCVLGTTPLICNRMSQKAWHELLAPAGRKSASAKASSMKHDPVAEFRASPYVLKFPTDPTRIAIAGNSFKRSMSFAALRMDGVTKTEIDQLIYMPGSYTPIFGIPKLFMAITRSADIKKTPDVRTRAIIPEWAARLSITFVKPQLREQGVANLLAAAGIICGVSDWRQQKGSGSYGSFKLVGPDDPDFVRITSTMGREAQDEALELAEPYDDEASEMLAWYDVEVKRRGFKVAA